MPNEHTRRRGRRWWAAPLAVTAFTVPGCAPTEGEPADDPPALSEAPVETSTIAAEESTVTAVATIRPTSNREVEGVVRFEGAGAEGIRVTSSFTGLTPGAHGYHIHVSGDCSAPDAASAGPHFNLREGHNSSAPSPEAADRILGNLGEVMADESGQAVHEALLPEASLDREGAGSIIGRAVIIHERGNDPESPPDGDAGDRVGCGVIGISGSG